LGHHLEKLNSTVLDDVDIPDLFMGLYDGIVVIDHLEQKTYGTALGIVSDPNQRMNSLIEKLQTALDAPAPDLIEELPNDGRKVKSDQTSLMSSISKPRHHS
jgi:anthranilate/para-aminobenzoate synthase component I